MSELPKFLPADAQCIGSVAVDSGTVHIGDPCYLTGWVERTLDEGNEPWDAYCDAMHGTNGNDGPNITQPIGLYSGLHLTTTWGDGLYPVYAALNEIGRPKWVLIDFFGEEDDE